MRAHAIVAVVLIARGHHDVITRGGRTRTISIVTRRSLRDARDASSLDSRGRARYHRVALRTRDDDDDHFHVVARRLARTEARDIERVASRIRASVRVPPFVRGGRDDFVIDDDDDDDSRASRRVVVRCDAMPRERRRAIDGASRVVVGPRW